MSAWRTRSCGTIAGVAVALAVSACGSGARQDATEPHRSFPVRITEATFPTSQALSEHAHLVISVHNSGRRTIPDVAVTVCNVTCDYPAPKGEGTSAAAFASSISQQFVANPSRPVWIIDHAPGKCGYSCRNGGAGAGVTAYSNTWALGALRPGRTVRFDWAVTAVAPGRHVVAWQVAAGLNGRAKAILADGSQPHGSFAVHVTSAPRQSFVNGNGQVVTQQ